MGNYVFAIKNCSNLIFLSLGLKVNKLPWILKEEIKGLIMRRIKVNFLNLFNLLVLNFFPTIAIREGGVVSRK